MSEDDTVSLTAGVFRNGKEGQENLSGREGGEERGEEGGEGSAPDSPVCRSDEDCFISKRDLAITPG
jgi:hypothetical protein